MRRDRINSLAVGSHHTESAPTRNGPLTVSQLTAMVKHAIQSALPTTVHVVGEISNLKRHTSGHVYLTLKDDASELSCVMWRSDAAKLRFTPQDGLEVIATGSVEVFERAGRYQLYIRKLDPRGVGAFELAFRQLYEKLEKEGLFDPRRKRPLPQFPRRIAVVTSPTGAAIRDILRTIERRYPCVHVLVYPVRVQGEGAAADIAAAIRALNANAESLGGIDVLIAGRGGGSIEDLWAFNEEVVARAIHASRIPVVSAVGHEVDITIADLVADIRAATPSAAAELVTPVRDEVLELLASQALRLARTVRAKMDLGQTKFRALGRREPFRDPMLLVRRREQVLDELGSRADRGLVSRLHRVRRMLEALEPVIQRIAPHAYLLRTGVRLRDAEHALRLAAARRMARAQMSASEASRVLDLVSPAHRLPRLADRLTRLSELLPAAVRRRLTLAGQHVRSQEALLGAVSHKSVLSRGFSITRSKKGRKIVRSVGEVTDGQRLITQVSDGQFESEALNVRQMELFE